MSLKETLTISASAHELVQHGSHLCLGRHLHPFSSIHLRIHLFDALNTLFYLSCLQLTPHRAEKASSPAGAEHNINRLLRLSNTHPTNTTHSSESERLQKAQFMAEVPLK